MLVEEERKDDSADNKICSIDCNIVWFRGDGDAPTIIIINGSYVIRHPEFPVIM
jgi:hypothetical protein